MQYLELLICLTGFPKDYIVKTLFKIIIINDIL